MDAQAAPPAPKLVLHPSRQSPDDLEVTGMLGGLARGGRGYVTYAELLTLPQVRVQVRNDENLPGPAQGVMVQGISLQVLARALGALPGSDLVDALCTDDYRTHYSATYIAAHHPLLGLLIEHRRAADWAARTHQYDPGPYFITHAHFVPTSKVLAHQEQPQVPTNVIRLNFSTTAETYGAIAPRGPAAKDVAVQQGFVIARQNCLRCHNQGAYGGTKSGRDWMGLSTWAREQPGFFAGYVHGPQAFEEHAHMPAFAGYDRPTLAALTAYFRTFTAERARPGSDAGR